MAINVVFFFLLHFQVEGTADLQKPKIFLDKSFPLTVGDDIKISCLFNADKNISSLRIKCTNARTTAFRKINDTSFLAILNYKLVHYEHPELCTCAGEVRNNESPRISEIRLIVKENPRIHSDENVNCRASTRMDISCRISTRFPLPYIFLPWLHVVDDEIVRSINSLFHDNYTSVIRISACSLADYGNYTCRIMVNYGDNEQYVVSQNTELTITGEPFCLSSDSFINDNTAVLMFTFYSIPRMSDIGFMKSGQVLNMSLKYGVDSIKTKINIDMYNVSVMIDGQKVYLTIKHLEDQDFVIYTAIVRNFVGTSKCPAELKKQKDNAWFLREKITTSVAITCVIVIVLLIVYIHLHRHFGRSFRFLYNKQNNVRQPSKTIGIHQSSKNETHDQKETVTETSNVEGRVGVFYQNTFSGNYENSGSNNKEEDSLLVSQIEEQQTISRCLEDNGKDDIMQDVLFLSSTADRKTIMPYDYTEDESMFIVNVTDQHRMQKHETDWSQESVCSVKVETQPTFQNHFTNSKEEEVGDDCGSTSSTEDRVMLHNRYYNITDNCIEGEKFISSTTERHKYENQSAFAEIGGLNITSDEDDLTVEKKRLKMLNQNLEDQPTNTEVLNKAMGFSSNWTEHNNDNDLYESVESHPNDGYEPVESNPYDGYEPVEQKSINLNIHSNARENIDAHYQAIEESYYEKDIKTKELCTRYSENYGYATVQDTPNITSEYDDDTCLD